MLEDIAFGDVFAYQGDDYVYFAESPEDGIIYAGKILDHDNTKQLQAMSKLAEKRGNHISDADMFSYVVLSTQEFKNQAVLCAIYNSNVSLSAPRQSLASTDLEMIKQEIMDRPGLTKLKQLIELLS